MVIEKIYPEDLPPRSRYHDMMFRSGNLGFISKEEDDGFVSEAIKNQEKLDVFKRKLRLHDPIELSDFMHTYFSEYSHSKGRSNEVLSLSFSNALESDDSWKGFDRGFYFDKVPEGSSEIFIEYHTKGKEMRRAYELERYETLKKEHYPEGISIDLGSEIEDIFCLLKEDLERESLFVD